MSKPDDPAPVLISELLFFGLPISEIANQTKLSRTSIYRLADGSIRNPSYSTVTRLQQLRDRTASSITAPKAGVITRKL